MNVSEAYQRGRQDNANGLEMEDCPYPEGSDDAADWLLGWIFNEDSSNS